MKIKLIATSILFSSTVFAGPYIETRDAYNTASEEHELILRAGYNFDQGAGLMFTNAYNVGKWNMAKHSYNEIEGWYPLLKPTSWFTIQPGGLVNANSRGSGGAVYLDTIYNITDWFNIKLRLRYNRSNYSSVDLDNKLDNDDSYEFVNYLVFKINDSLTYSLDTHYYERVNNFNASNGKDHSWEIDNGFRYKLDQNWLPYLDLQWLDRSNYYNREIYRIRVGLRYSF